MSVTLHTNVGDVKIEVFCESVPKTAEVDISYLMLVPIPFPRQRKESLKQTKD